MKFKDRNEAAEILAKKLQKYKNSNAIIMAIPRGGVPLGFIIANALKLPLEVILSKKIGHPYHKEFAIGAATLKSRILSDAARNVAPQYIEDETNRIKELLKKRYKMYYGNKKPMEIKDKTVIIVDDGIATGNTILSTIKMLHDEKPSKIVVAIPVAPPDTLRKLHKSPFIDEVIYILSPENFRAVGQFYDDFDQVEDKTVNYLLNKAHAK
ncbi:phosphoribosyltransferase [Changchengzhania lutea]|uniref:phosphoribosyltransferase n=1 Tax=Changchengzhania lutea TaxID=2049305 RepID=UPI00115ED5C2|nr:phosphoribosyltransferase family protein [Changchengzhania lutea]